MSTNKYRLLEMNVRDYVRTLQLTWKANFNFCGASLCVVSESYVMKTDTNMTRDFLYMVLEKKKNFIEK